ncbi:MAG: C25 family cysteine peptidase [candidate division KSB1 bacterium]|nr:C25 family cysteine peptidase [candidate division KSB1 bacterium]
MRGQTRSSSANDHHIQVDINGFTGVDAFFDDREERIYRFKVPGDLIYSRDNALIIRSVRQSSDPISRFYFDWLECDSPVRFQAHDDRLCFSDSTLPAHASIRVSGFSGDSVFVWNQTSGDIIAPTISQSVIRRIRVVSAGLADGNRAEFLIDGETMYSGSRGISLVFLDSHSGEFLYSKTYDTYGSETASQELSNNIAEVPDGTIVLAAVRDDGASRLSEQAIASLQNCGSQYIDELKYRDSWAFIGRKNDTTTVYEQHTLKGAGQAAVSTFLEFQGTAQDFTATFQAENLNNSAFIVFEENSIRKPKLINRSEIRNPLHHPARYLIITDPMFEEAAQQLADYRKDQEHISSAEIIFVQDIYDTFNDGIKHPRAIKTFLRDAWQIWGVEKPRYVLLLGDASWDPKLNMPDSRFRDIIPSLGNPVSDVLYSCFDDLLPELAIGRLPAATAEQAAMLVSKIIEYENTPPAEWNKHLLFISGGFDAVEQSRFNSQSQALSDEFVSPAPFGGDAYHIKKSDATLIEGEHTANIIDHFAKGMAWVNFIGHAGSRTWELFFHNSDIDRLNNAPYYPFISSMTCHTGRFAEPGDESFGEHFINARQKGCVAFWGTSGWGYTYEDNQLLRQLYPAILQDTVRILGDALNQAKVGLWEQQGVTSHVTNVILQYNLLGDPAMRLQLPNQPDLTFSDDPINIEPRIPSEADSTAQITCALSNIGLFPPDSLQFRLRATSQENPETRITWNLKREPFTLTDTIKVTWPLAGMSGTVNLDASIDAQDAIPESNEQNNSATLTTQVYSSSVRLVQPAEFARISNGAVTCIVENPPNIPYKELSYEFQLDTSRTFSSPVLKTRTRQADPLQTLCPFNDVQPGIYFWRVRILDQTPPLWQTGSFTAVSDSLNGWQQASAQFIENSYQSTQSGSNGVRLSTENISLRVESAGKRQGNFARILVNSQSVMPTSRGFNVAVLTNNCAEICATATFDTWGNEQASEKLADFISNVPENDYVLVAVKDEASNRLYEPALNALETLGSVHCRDIGPFDSWAIIGRKGAPPGNVPEAYSPSDQETIAAVSDSIRRHAAFGQILSPKIGPAAAWSKAEIQSTLPDSTNINVHLIGHPISGAPDTLYTGSPANSLDLSFIDAQHTPYLSLGAQLSSQNYRITPVLQSWHVLFDPTPDIALSPQLFSQNRDTVTSGEPVTFYFDVYNLGASMTDSGSIRILSKNRGEDLHTLYYPPLAHSKSHALTFETPISASGITHFYITADPENELVESSESNNVLHTTVFAKKDTIPPTLLITVDDRPVYDGDLISPRPNIVISIQDNNQKSIRDTSQINLSLNGARISFTDQDVLTYNKETQNIYFSPQLDDGHHKLIVNVFDSENNSTAESFAFEVKSELVIRNALNYPNPFSEATEFSFGLSRHADINISIYTLAGRKIKELSAGRRSPGYHQIPWDGYDADGDIPANGVYLYQIRAESEKEQKTVLNKCIIAR